MHFLYTYIRFGPIPRIKNCCKSNEHLAQQLPWWCVKRLSKCGAFGPSLGAILHEYVPPKYFPSSDPRPHTLFWHSCRHTIWKYLWHMYSDILSDTLSISFILFLVLSGNLSGMYSDIVSGIYSGILFVSPNRIFLKHGRPSPSIILSATDTLMKSGCVLPIHIMLLNASGGISGFWRHKLLRQDAPTHTVRCSSVTPGHVEIHGSASKVSIRARKEPYEIAATIQMGSVGAGCCCHAIRQVEFLASSWHIMHIAGRLGMHLFFFGQPKTNAILIP